MNTEQISEKEVIETKEQEVTQEEVTEKPKLSLEDQLRETMKSAKDEAEKTKEPEQAEAKPRDETGKFKSKEVKEVKIPEVETPPPASLTGAIKAKWKELPEDVRAEWAKRENEVHQMFTRHDGELRLGREMKEAVMPYMATIQAEGGTPAKAVAELLNTAYMLRTADPYRKAQLVNQIIQTYGVDVNLMQHGQQNRQDPVMSQLMNEIQALKQQANPEVIKNQLQEEMENARVMEEVNAFSSNPENRHYQQVKSLMATLLANGQASDMREAYDKACYATPEVRSTLEAEKRSADEAKRKAEVEAKKKAATLSGSPSRSLANSTSPKRSLEDELRANLRAAQGSAI